jgi:hypothetical protein
MNENAVNGAVAGSSEASATKNRPVLGAIDNNPSEQSYDEFIFNQRLNEVHILIDFVSGRADRNLCTLSIPDPREEGTDQAKMLTSAQLVSCLAKMRYKTDPVENAKNDAILLLAKDRLSALANPARGLTIAYTTMFVDAEAKRGLLNWIRLLFGRVRYDNGYSRIDSAIKAFPWLQPHARLFRIWRDGLIWASMIWVVLTALTYWDVGIGRSVLEHLDQNWKAHTQILQTNPNLASDRQCNLDYPTNVSVNPPPNANETKQDGETDHSAAACLQLSYLYQMRELGNIELNRVFRCEDMNWLSHALHIWCWRWILSGSIPDATLNSATPSHLATEVDWQTAASVLSVFTTFILPTMFGLLGTLMGAFRSILNKIRDNELGPRDLVRMKLGIPLGLVAGIAVGLFLNPISSPVQGAGDFARDVSLTASGLGFLAGYGCQTFFRFVDELLGRVFPENGSTSAAATTQHPAASGVGS